MEKNKHRESKGTHSYLPGVGQYYDTYGDLGPSIPEAAIKRVQEALQKPAEKPASRQRAASRPTNTKKR